MRESKFQASFVKRIRQTLPQAIVLKNNPNYLQGVPDFIVLNEDRWATLEFKASRHAATQPNQTYYVTKMNRMSFSAFVYPENELVVFEELMEFLR